MRYSFKITDDTNQALSTKSEENIIEERKRPLLIKLQRLQAVPHRPQTTGLAPDLRGI